MIINEEDEVWFPNNVINKCPAIILADNRTAKVPGRIILLIDSIKTIKDINTVGVFCGTKWMNIWLVWLIQPNSIKANHIGMAKDKLVTKWLVLVKIYGNRPMKLFNIIKIRIEININVLPFIAFKPSNNLNSLCKIFIKLLNNIKNILGIIQNVTGIIKIKINELNQLLNIGKDEEGSKIENKFLIIFNW